MAFSAVLTGTGQSVNATNGSSSLAVAATSGWVVGATIQGTGIPAGARVGTIVTNTSVQMVNASGSAVNFTGTTGAVSVIVSSKYGSTLTVSQSGATDYNTPQDIINAGMGNSLVVTTEPMIHFPGGLTVLWSNIVSGAVFDFGQWSLYFGDLGRWQFDGSTILGELRGGYLVNGTQFLKTAGPTFYCRSWNNGTAGGSNMWTGTATGAMTGKFRMNNARFVEVQGSNASFYFAAGRMEMIVDNMILDHTGDSAGANAGIGAAFGVLNNTTILKANSSILATNGTNFATFNGLYYVGNYQSTPQHKFSLPNGFVLDSYAPQVLSTQFLGGFSNGTTETYSNINLDTAGWGLNDLKTKYLRYGGTNVLNFPRTVSFQFNDSTAANLSDVTLYIKSGSTSLVNAVQAGDYSAATQALILNWTTSISSYRVCDSFVDTISQVAQFRKNGYISQSVSYSLNTAAYSQPVFMLSDPAYGSVTPAQAAALTGLSLDYTNDIYTVSTAHNLDEVYAFGQYSQALTANSTQADFQASTGGKYSLISPWKMNVTGGALTMGTYNNTFNSSTAWTFGNTSSLNLNKDDVVWTPSVRADLFQFQNGSTLNITNGSSLTVSPTAGLGYGAAATSEFRSGSTLNMSDSTVTYNIVSGGSGTVFSNSEAGSTWNISNSTLTLNCPNGAQVAIHAYFLPASVINNFTVNGTASNVIWQMGYTSNNSKMVGFKYGGAIFGNGTSNILMDTYTYTGALTTIPNTFGSANKWYWVDPVMQAGGLFRWAAGSTATGSSGFYGVIGFRPTISTDKDGYAPKVRFTPSAMATRYPAFQVQTAALSTLALSSFFRDPTFMGASDGFLPFVDSLDDKTVINTINWTADFRQKGWLANSVTFTAATAKKGLVTYTASGAVDANYINDTTGAADAALITVNETTKIIAAATGTLAWSAQRMYNAIINKWASFAIEQNIVAASTGGTLSLADYTVDESIRFVRGLTTDLVSQVRTTGIIESQANEIPVADVNGSRASVTGLDPQGFGVTWFLRWQKAGTTTWTTASGTGNSTQIVVDAAEYTLQARVRGYDWKTVTLDATLSLSIDLSLAYHISANNTPQHTMVYDAVLEAIFAFDASVNKVSVANSTSGILSPGFAELYQATQRIQHLPDLVWTWTSPVTANATSQKIIIPTGNPISMYLTDASTNTVKITCPVIHADTGSSADDRVRGNASGYSIILGSPATAESAGLASQIISGLGGPNFDGTEHGLSVIKSDQDLAKAVLDLVKTAVDAVKLQTDKLPDSPAAVGDAMTLTSGYDAAKTAATQTSVDAVAADVLAVTANVWSAETRTLTDSLTLSDIEGSTVLAKASDIPQGLTAADVWAATDRTLTETPGLTSTQAEQLRKVAQLHGVGAELVVTATSRTAGDVSQTITSTEDQTTVSSA